MNNATTYPNAGVYMMTSKKNGKNYIGSSTDVPKRLNMHMSAIRNGTHTHPGIAKWFKGHKATDIKFEILQRCDVGRTPGESDPFHDPAAKAGRAAMLLLELDYIDKLKPALNRKGKRVPVIGVDIPILDRTQVA